MMAPEDWMQSVFKISEESEFNSYSLEVFRFQYAANTVYREFVDYLGLDPKEIKHYSNIPFLPVAFFKDHNVICGNKDDFQKVFTSSGTTGSVPSRHYIRNLEIYAQSFSRSFRLFYGDPALYRFLVLLPGYLERSGSSLVYMMDQLVRESAMNGSGFYLHDFEALQKKLSENKAAGVKTVLFGASYALLDFAEQYTLDLKDVIVMETGGMKGRRKEMIREELHGFLCSRFNVKQIHSEYGMTELLSQAYSKGNDIFAAPPWMKVLIRDTNDPFCLLPSGQTGGVNIIDLANVYSCSFIATQDLGKRNDDGSFEILGRFDDSDIRGCNLLVV